MSRKPERNDPCPCGSGKKYKKCCEQKEFRRSKPIKARLICGGSTQFSKMVLNQGVGLIAAAKHARQEKDAKARLQQEGE